MDADHAARTESNRAIVHRIYDHFHRGELDEVGTYLAEDVDWHIEGPSEVFAFGGACSGRQAVLSALRTLVGRYEHLQHEPRFIMVDGDRACMFAVARIRDRETGRVAGADICDLIELRDGKVVWFREIFDSLAAAEQMAPGAIRQA